ncbi:hypothetical protein VOLCADRAFT_127407 [Volvox carteri f. nagariensis]|uniref:Protein kinase domain-containing protein n=1 Tax=Volvox carteri f. nagariensis TaxID=3068 RepID=D8TN31_VOLCA|nr:uncharacterized protein VOLCADRAFT_127407 [Volvox carteri f. nagariensis]EFJ51232.1 hypothetical protein VOLCADRAFT_127407 [Volvox carteri f. nagariensis]|eukprot:XP_002947699.1 hypothetical protein VOLCADRAFT_127407 [Volvox carteri f. nagariensis]
MTAASPISCASSGLQMAPPGASARNINPLPLPPQPDTQSAPQRSLGVSCISEQLAQLKIHSHHHNYHQQQGQIPLESDRRDVAPALSLEASLSAPPNWHEELQRVCSLVSSAGVEAAGPAGHLVPPAKPAVAAAVAGPASPGATCKLTGLPVALKVYFLSRTPHNVLHQVAREIQIHLGLHHKNVLDLYGAFQDSKRLVLVTELAMRGDLFALKSAMDRPMSEEQLRYVVLVPLLDALSYLHGKGICHRDIKPENLLITADWGLRLADFGVSINLTEERAVTRAGTGEWAPEVDRCPLKTCPEDNKDDMLLAYTTAADVWSVGVLVYELLVGFPPILLGKGGLKFPASVSAGARDFIISALAHLPEERPTVRQLRCHPWMLAAGAATASH